MKVLFFSDLHISSSHTDYCFSVLDEIIEIVENEKIEVLIIAGDLFDSFKDIELYRDRLRTGLNKINAVRIFYIPGNHEYLGIGKNSLESYDFGSNVELVLQKPFHYIVIGDTEFLFLPFMKDYSDFINWSVPEKTDRKRVVVVHSTIAGLIYTGCNDGEVDVSYIDSELFVKVRADLVLAGHIHKMKDENLNGIRICYPGSARVWRSGEFDKRSVGILNIDNESIVIKNQVIKSAGEYREFKVTLDFDGKTEPPESIFNGIGNSDYILVEIHGFADDDSLAQKAEDDIKKYLTGRVRAFEVGRSHFTVIKDISQNPVAKRFIEILDGMKTEINNDELWHKVREIGLNSIKSGGNL